MTDTVPFVASHVSAILEGVRLLESVVTAPLGLHSDIKMVRQSLPFPEAADLSREEERDRRTAFSSLTNSPLDLALHTISSLSVSLDVLESAGGEGGAPFDEAWVVQARNVLARAEARVAGDIRATRTAAVSGLYVIIDPDGTGDRPVLDVAGSVLRGGASVLQLRDKTRDKGEVLGVALDLKAMCEEYDALFIVNDDADLALSSGADGLHVGLRDLPVRDARRVLTPRQIVGRSSNTLQEAMDAQAQEVDYISIGPVYATAASGNADRVAVGPELVGEARRGVGQPVIAIGGIDATNVAQVVSAGADCICVASAVTLAGDPEAASSELVGAIARASA